MNKYLNIRILALLFVILFISNCIFSCKEKEKDTTAPSLVLKGDNPFYLAYDSTYIEPGCIAIDNVDGDISNNVKVTGTIDNHTEGIYFLNYSVSDAAGNTSETKKREIRVMKF